MAAVRWLAIASIPAWLQLHWRFLPGLLAWLAFLTQGGCLAMAAAFAALEYRWAGRVERLEPDSGGTMVHVRWTGWDELRSALWCGLALVALVPWAYLGSGRPIPPSLLSSLTATLWTVLLLLGAAESLASLSALRDRHPHRQGSQAPQAPRLEGGGPRG